MPMICICSPQGGSGRSSLAVNLAGAYAHRGNKVLLMDFNVQNSLLLHFNIGDGVVQVLYPILVMSQTGLNIFIKSARTYIYCLMVMQRFNSIIILSFCFIKILL